jgi:hypothetical protein
MKYDTKNKLLDTVLDISPTQVTEAFKAEIDSETPDRIQKQDEMWLVQLPGCNTLERDPPNGAERQTLKRSAANEGLLWSSLTCLLRTIFKATTKLVGFRERHQPQQEDAINRTLTILNSALKSLARLLSRSGSIWRLLRNPAIANAIKVGRDVLSSRRGIDPVIRNDSPILNSISLLPIMRTWRILGR